jgi:F-box and WD-40 domain protein CDC4
MNMDFFLSDEITSPPATPPSIADTLMETHLHDNGNIIATSRPMQKQRSSYIEVGSSSMDKSQLDYIGKVKSNFQQFTLQQQLFFLSEILGSCDNQLLQYVYTFITPKLKKDFLKELPIELSLHVLSFIDDPRTLARASRVNRFWNRLLKDEAAWKALCLKHQYNSHFQYYKQSNQVVSYRDFFRRKYNIDTAWNQGGRVTPCENQIGDCLATSVQMDDTFIAVGCDNNRIEVFDATTGKHIRSLLDHEGGVWALQFIKNKNNEHILVTGGCDR